MDKKPIDYKMNDPKWKNKLYTATGNPSQTMGQTGCGPTAMADVLAEFCSASINPWQVAQQFMNKGFRTRNAGTAYGAFKWAFTQHKGKGLKKFAAGKSMGAMKDALAQGALVICSMGPGYWTSGGHFVVAWKMDEQYVYACDPGGKVRKKQEASAFGQQCKKMFAFWPGEQV